MGLPEGTNVNFPPQSKTGGELTPEDVRVYGRREMGAYWAPSPMADLINNNLRPGIRASNAVKIINAVNRNLNMWELGWSYFHGLTTTLNASVSDVALAADQLTGGKPVQAAVSAARGIVPFASVIRDFYKGTHILDVYKGKEAPKDAVEAALIGRASCRERV